MEFSNSVSIMPRGMLIGTPCFLMRMRIGTAGCEPTGRSSSLGGPFQARAPLRGAGGVASDFFFALCANFQTLSRTINYMCARILGWGLL